MNNTIKMLVILFMLLFISCNGDPFVNSETSEISSVDPYTYCLEKNTWDTLTKLYSINEIKDSSFRFAIKRMNHHWTSPKYILYFKDSPQEIIACEYYAIRLVYNPRISSEVISGNDIILSDNEQVRIRNRVLNLLANYACDSGKIILRSEMNKPAVFSKEYYEDRKKWYNIFD